MTLLISFICMLFSDAQAQSVGERAVADGLSQTNPVQIGLRIPETFWTKEHLFFINGDTVRKTLEEHKGKMVVLDFWFSGCTPCLNHQSEIKSFSEQYKNDLVVIMVNSKKTRETYQKIRTLYDKDFFLRFGIRHVETIIEDDFLEQLFPYSSYPHYVWINKAERLQLRTFRNLLDRNYVAPFIDRLW